MTMSGAQGVLTWQANRLDLFRNSAEADERWCWYCNIGRILGGCFFLPYLFNGGAIRRRFRSDNN